jgi:four helix bundle protein
VATIRRFEELEAWQTARALTKLVYELASVGAFSRDYGLRDQIRRAAVSVMSNIAEGFESRTKALFIDYLGRAKGSAGEVRSQLYVALDCRYLSDEQFTVVYELADKVTRQVANLITYLQSQSGDRHIGEEKVGYTLERENV